jgi:hypothetical protein
VGTAVLVGVQLDGLSVGIASFHFAPFPDSAHIREAQLQAIMEVMQTEGCDCVLLAGDANMRKRENTMPEQFGLVDAFTSAGSPPTACYSWDSFENQYHNDSNSYPFRCRFDRVMFGSPSFFGQCAAHLGVRRFSLVGHQPATAECKTHFLSDHFGLCATIDYVACSIPLCEGGSGKATSHQEQAERCLEVRAFCFSQKIKIYPLHPFTATATTTCTHTRIPTLVLPAAVALLQVQRW